LLERKRSLLPIALAHPIRRIFLLHPFSIPKFSAPSATAATLRPCASTTDPSMKIPEKSNPLSAINWHPWDTVLNRSVHHVALCSFADLTSLLLCSYSITLPESCKARKARIITSMLLLVAYQQSSFHIWDFTQLDAVKEAFHLGSIDDPILSASIIEATAAQSPTLFLLADQGDEWTMSLYSLGAQTIRKCISILNAYYVLANEHFVCVGVKSSIMETMSPAS